MPDITDESMVNLETVSNYSFSGVGLSGLGASEYTLVTIAVDVSGSVTGWITKLEDCIKAIVKSCQSSPRAENLLIRLLTFSNSTYELHGFRILEDIELSEYDNSLKTVGMTALYDATQNAVDSTIDYGTFLVEQGDMSANAVVYVITDGLDNASTHTPNTIKKSIENAVSGEYLESLAVILIGVGNDKNISNELDGFKSKAGINQFVDLTKLFNEGSPEKALAKLAGYVSKSISATSQSLSNGTGGVSSALLTF
jgi:uncharacterized protein YegL